MLTFLQEIAVTINFICNRLLCWKRNVDLWYMRSAEKIQQYSLTTILIDIDIAMLPATRYKTVDFKEVLLRNYMGKYVDNGFDE